MTTACRSRERVSEGHACIMLHQHVVACARMPLLKIVKLKGRAHHTLSKVCVVDTMGFPVWLDETSFIHTTEFHR